METRIRIIRVPYDSGHRGWRMGAGPEVLAGEELIGSLPGDTVVRDVSLDSALRYEMAATLELHRRVAVEIAEARDAGEMPVVFSGNCNVPAIGAAAATSGNAGCVWFDAHGDFNTAETTPSGFFDGMALAALTGSAWRTAIETIPGFEPIAASNTILVGARDLDGEEEIRLRESAITWIPPQDLESFPGALEKLSAGAPAIYLHVDVDVLDPRELTANEYASPGGLTLDQLVESIRLIAGGFMIVAVGIAAYDPARDRERRGPSIVRAILDALAG